MGVKTAAQPLQTLRPSSSASNSWAYKRGNKHQHVLKPMQSTVFEWSWLCRRLTGLTTYTVDCKLKTNYFSVIRIIIITINPITATVVGAPQMILQPIFSIFQCSPLPSGTCRTPGLSTHTHTQTTSNHSVVCLILAASDFPQPR